MAKNTPGEYVRKWLTSFLLIAVFAGGAVMFVRFVFFTPEGAVFITKAVLSRYVRFGVIEVENVRGNLATKLVWENVTVSDIRGLPEQSHLKIQRMELFFTSLSLNGLNAVVTNGRLKLPLSGDILVYGELKDKVPDFTVYARRLSVEEILGIAQVPRTLLTGSVLDFDFKLTGTVSEPAVDGTFTAERVSHKGFTLKNCLVDAALVLRDWENRLKLEGTVRVRSGTLTAFNKVSVGLEPGRIIFSGDPLRPKFFLSGKTKVQNTLITLGISGTRDEPELAVRSDPPKPRDILLAMLVTGREYASFERAAEEGTLSADFVKDFIDLFLFAGSGGRINRFLRLKDVSLDVNQETRELEKLKVETAVTDKVQAGYGMERTPSKEGETPEVKHKLSGEVKVTDTVSFGAERELPSAEQQQKEETESKLFLRFRKKF